MFHIFIIEIRPGEFSTTFRSDPDPQSLWTRIHSPDASLPFNKGKNIPQSPLTFLLQRHYTHSLKFIKNLLELIFLKQKGNILKLWSENKNTDKYWEYNVGNSRKKMKIYIIASHSCDPVKKAQAFILFFPKGCDPESLIVWAAGSINSSKMCSLSGLLYFLHSR